MLISISFSFYDIQIMWFYYSKQLYSSLYVMMCWLCLTGLKLQGATCKKNKLQLSTSISTELPVTLLKWIRWVPLYKHVSLTSPHFSCGLNCKYISCFIYLLWYMLNFDNVYSSIFSSFLLSVSIQGNICVVTRSLVVSMPCFAALLYCVLKI